MSPQIALRRVLFTLLGLAVALGGSILLAPAAHAQVAPQSYIVTTTDDTPTDANCAVNNCTLRQAVNASNLNAPGASPAHNTITFAASVFGSIALANTEGHGTLTLTKSVTITSVGSITVDGGGMFSVFAVNEGVTAGISGLNINNGGGSGGGGGVRNNGNLSLTNLSLTNSTSDGGGGVLNNASSILTVTSCIFSSDTAPDLGGGAIFNGGMATITNSTFSQNSAGFGGAIGNGGTLIVTGSAFAGNSSSTLSIGSGEGGAIANIFSVVASGISIQVTNSTFSSNMASTKGGAFYNDTGTTLQTTNVTVSGNQATTSGGGIYSAGATTLTNTLVASSTGGDLSNGAAAPTGTFGGNNNLIDDSTFTLLTTGTGNVNKPALLDPNGARINSGTVPTQTVALLPGSPAIGGGTTSGEGIPTTDQRGYARTGHNDIGAFQSQGFVLTVASGTTPQTTIINSPFANPLGVTVTSPTNDPVIGGTVTFTISSGAGLPSGAFGAPGSCTVSGDHLTAACPITGVGIAVCAAPSGPRPASCGTPSGISTSPTVTANGTVGQFNAGATTNGAPPSAPFVLTNQIVACVVNSTMDPAEAGKTTLRDAVRVADSGGCTNNNTITFDSGVFPPGTAETIPVAASPFELSFTGGPTTIDGTGHNVVIDGGGVIDIFAVDPDVTATLIALTMQNGINSDGGGAILNSGTLTVASSTLNHNSGLFAEGGAIENLNTLTVRDSTFTNNTAAVGGAIATNNGPLTVTGSTFVGNNAVQPTRNSAPSPRSTSKTVRPADGFSSAGGAIFVCSCSTAVITNSTFSANTAASVGGAILDEGVLTLTNVTISGNSATNGGGVFIDNGSGGTLRMKNALIAGNTLSGSSGAGPDINGLVDSASANNLIGVGDGSTGLSNGTGGNRVGMAAAPIAPLLGTLGNYGGSTQTLPLLPGSPAIDTGTTGTGVPATDQRGKPRVGAPDIGAFESQGFALVIVSGSPQTQQINTAFAPLVVSVTSATEPVAGGLITFTGPTSGAGIQTSSVTVTIAASGQASITPIANGVIGGPYAVVATTSGATPPSVSFQLTNAARLLTITGPAHLKVGETEQYTATEPTVTKAALSPPDVVWHSSDVTIATISADGKVTALHAGPVIISATTSDAAGSLPVQVDTPILTGVQAAPAPPGRSPGTAGNPGGGAPAPAPVPPSR
jgi:predicted outer membrane repeat protein